MGAGPALPNAGLSLLRVVSSLALVLALFFAAVWCFRNWHRLTLQRTRAPKLRVIEARALGQRQALYVVAYEQQRFLVAASPAGLALLTRLPDGAAEEAPLAARAPNFTAALQHVLASKA
jgi:flagellar biosynthetic protein FliO